jgi:hypothetical protein
VEEDFITESQDDQTLKKKKVQTILLTKRPPKDDAVPSKFLNCPKYLSKTAPTKRSGEATSSSRLEKSIR